MADNPKKQGNPTPPPTASAKSDKPSEQPLVHQELPASAALNLEALLVAGACPACAGRGKVENGKWAEWRRKKSDHEARLAQRQQSKAARMEPIPAAPTPPPEPTEKPCLACASSGWTLTELGQRLVGILLPFVKAFVKEALTGKSSPLLPQLLPDYKPPVDPAFAGMKPIGGAEG